MGYLLDVSREIDGIFAKLQKDKARLEIINKKVSQILADPNRFKPLRGDMHGARRVHIDKSFVLTYEVDENSKIVRLLDFDHHDKIYKR